MTRLAFHLAVFCCMGSVVMAVMRHWLIALAFLFAAHLMGLVWLTIREKS